MNEKDVKTTPENTDGEKDELDEDEEGKFNVNELIARGKGKGGSLTSSEIIEALGDADYDIDQIDKLERALPGLDCGSCGSPTCRALAEDIVEGQANEDQCIFLMREKLQKRLYGRQEDSNLAPKSEAELI